VAKFGQINPSQIKLAASARNQSNPQSEIRIPQLDRSAARAPDSAATRHAIRNTQHVSRFSHFKEQSSLPVLKNSPPTPLA
jgi:hypothetical protein